MKDLQQWAAVTELHRQKVPKQQIAKQLNISRNTVKRLLSLKEEPRYIREHYPSKMEPYMEKIILWRTDPEYDFNGTRIFRELKKLGYTGTINPIYRALQKLDEESCGEISKKATVRVETPPGDQAQFDWSEYQVPVNCQIRTIYCFSLVLAASRKKAVCFSLTVDAEAIYEAIQELFDDLGGITQELLIDNPKALVIDNNPRSEDEIRYNPQALLLAAHLGTELNACNCYWPRTKGKCEKPFQYIEEQFIKGNRFTSMEDLNTRGKSFITEWNNEVHTTTKRIPEEFFKSEEIHALLPLPGKRYRMSDLKTRIVSNDSYVSYATNKYSVPVKYATKQVKCRFIYGFRLEIYTDHEEFILSAEADGRKHDTFHDPTHYEPIAVKVSKSIPQIKRDFTATFSNGEEYLRIAGHLFQQPTYHARKILELTDLYDAKDLDKVLLYAINQSRLDITSFKKLLKEKYFEIIQESVTETASCSATFSDDIGLTRSCEYYEQQREVIHI